MYYSLLLAVLSGLLLGVWDVIKKKAFHNFSVFGALSISSISYFLLVSIYFKSALEVDKTIILLILVKATFLFCSWFISSVAIKHLPLSVITPFKSFIPLMSVILGMVVLSERLKFFQYAGILIMLVSYYLIGKSGSLEIGNIFKSIFFYLMLLSCVIESVSAVFDKVILRQVTDNQLMFWFITFMAIYFTIAWGIECGVKKKALDTVLEANPVSKFEPNSKTLLSTKRLKDKTPKSVSQYLSKINVSAIAMGLILVVSDKLYLMALNDPMANISIVLPLRNISILCSALLGGLLYKELNLKSKMVGIGLLLVGIVFLFVNIG